MLTASAAKTARDQQMIALMLSKNALFVGVGGSWVVFNEVPKRAVGHDLARKFVGACGGENRG
jgi:hypothetical protein